MKRWATPLLALAILTLNVWLNRPLFLPGELPFRGSIEDGYVGMARFYAEHPNPWGWNPFAYCGLPAQFMYVPALPYVTALFIHLLPHVSPDSVYRTIVGLLTCLGPVTLFLFAVFFTGSRWWSFGMALAYTFISPSYALFPAVDKDRGIVQLPWRIQVLAKYGEGPHDSGLTLLPVALLAVWRAAMGSGYPRVLAAAVLLAAVPLTNWVAAFSLAIACGLLLLAGWGEPGFRAWRALASAGLAYALACFWLTPTFVKTISFNWPVDSFGYRLQSKQAWLLTGVVLGALVIRLLFRFVQGSLYLRLAVLGSFVFGWIATAYYMYGIDTIPESRRYAIEFELFLTLAVTEGLRLAMGNANRTVRMCAIGTGGVILLVGAPQIWAYATQDRSQWSPFPAEDAVEHRLGEWIAQHPPQGRVFASGGLRFRLNAWFDLPQVGGGFETGVQNRVPIEMAYRIRTGNNFRPGHEAEDTLQALEKLGAEYVVVHGPKSREYYRDFLRPERLAGAPVAYHIEDDTIYRLPAHPLARLIGADESDASRPVTVRWRDSSTLSIDGPVPPGDAVAVQVNADPGWRAFQDGRAVPIERDAIGFMKLRPSPSGGTSIELRYTGTAEQRIMAGLCLIAWIAALAPIVIRRVGKFRPAGEFQARAHV